MRVVLVSVLFARADRLVALARGLAGRGHEVTYFTAEAVDVDKALQEPFEIITVPFVSAVRRVRHTVGVRDDVNLDTASRARGRFLSVLTRTAAHLYEALFNYPDKSSAWIRASRRWLRENRQLNGCDVVVAAAAPFTGHFVGRLIARSTGAALVLDFQDLWVTGNPYYPYGPVRRAIDERDERQLIDAADATVSFSEGFSERLSTAYQGIALSTIYVGIDPVPWRIPAVENRAELSFAHFGITYRGRRDLRPILHSLRRLADAGELDLSVVRVEVWGEYDDALRDAVVQLGLEDTVRTHDFIPPDRVPHELARSQVALLPMWEDDLVNLPLKTCHYLAAGKHIIVTGTLPESELSHRLAGLPGVDLCYDQQSLDPAVLALYTRWKRGEALAVPEETRPFTFTIDRMADEFEQVLERVQGRETRTPTS